MESSAFRRIMPGLDHAEKQLLLLPSRPRIPVNAVLERIQIVKILGALNDSNLRIGEEADRVVDHLRRGHMVRIQRDDELAAGLRHCVIQIAGLGMLSIPARNVAAVELLGQFPHLAALPVIEDVGFVRIIHVHSAQNRFPQELNRLVVGGDKNIHATARHGLRTRVTRWIPGEEIEEGVFDKAEHLRDQEHIEENPRGGVHRVKCTPPEIADGKGYGRNRHQADQCQLQTATRRQRFDFDPGTCLARRTRSNCRRSLIWHVFDPKTQKEGYSVS
jgi:hypothetical protein